MKQKSTFSKIFDPKMWFYDFVKITGGWPAVLDQRIKKIFVDDKNKKNWHKGRFIVCANHSTYTDPITIMNLLWKRRVVFIATKDLYKNKFSRSFLKKVGTIQVDQGNVTIETFKKANDVLNRGHVVAIFPEAHVQKERKIRDFAPGTIMMSVICNAPILPIYIAKREKKRNRQVIIIGKKVDYKKYTNGMYPTMDQIQQLTKELKQEEIKLKEKYDEWKETKNK